MSTQQTRTNAGQAKERPTPEQFLAEFPPEIQALANQLRVLIKQTIPNVDEAVYPGWHLIGYRLREGKRSRYFCFVAPHPDRVALGFEYGVQMTNDAGLLEGNGTQVRYVTIHQPEDIREQELGALIAEAAMVASTFKR
jgi:hypothetical protein